MRPREATITDWQPPRLRVVRDLAIISDRRVQGEVCLGHGDKWERACTAGSLGEGRSQDLDQHRGIRARLVAGLWYLHIGV